MLQSIHRVPVARGGLAIVVAVACVSLADVVLAQGLMQPTIISAGGVDGTNYGNGAGVVNNGIRERWFDGGWSDTQIIPFDPVLNNASFLAMVPNTLSTYTTNTNFSFNDGALDARGAAGTDNIGAVWSGYVTVGGPNLAAGNITFGTSSDDGMMIYVDTNQDGRFDGSELVVDNRGFHGPQNRVGTRNLAAGTYKMAMPFYEGGGGALAEARYASGIVTEANYGTMTLINPGAATQAGIWSFNDRDNDLYKTTGSVSTLTGNNNYNGRTHVLAGTLVAGSNTALGLADGTANTGTQVSNGATLELNGGGRNIGNEAITLGMSVGGPAGTLRSTGGSNTTTAGITLRGNGAIDNAGGSTLAIGGGVNMNGAQGGRLTVTGAGETTITGAITGNLATQNAVAGLIAGRLPGNPNLGANPGNLGVVMTVSGLYRDGGPNDAIREAHWFDGSTTDNQTLVYTGQIFLPGGNVTFVEQNDDNSYLTINGVQILNDTNWTNATSGTINLPAGWYDFEARFSNGGGGYGYFDQQWGAGPPGPYAGGFGMTTGIPGNTNPTSYTLMPTDPGNATLFRVSTPTDPNDLHFSGNGILRLNGANSYVGMTSVGNTNGAFGTPNATTGTLIVNGTTSGQGSFFISSGATLGGSGTIGLADNASVNISGSPGTVSPGDAGVGYNTYGFGPTFSEGQDIATVGTLTVNQPNAGDVAVNLNGFMEVDVVGVNPGEYDVLQATGAGGSIVLGPNAMLNINGIDGSLGNEWELLNLENLESGVDQGGLLTILLAADGVDGTFANLPGTFVDASDSYLVTIGQDANSVFISLLATPEPSTIALWSLLGVVGLVVAYRQRRSVR